MSHADWCRTCTPTDDCRHEQRTSEPGHSTYCAACGRTLVECPVCAPVTYAHCAGCAGLGWTTPRDAALVRVTLRR